MRTHVFTLPQSLVLVALICLIAWPALARAHHQAMVAGQVIDLADASLGHGENCDDVHYHGELNGVPDPDPDGCGHGIVTILDDDENGESIVPETTEDADDDEDSGFWNSALDWLDALFQGLTGGYSPKTTADSVDIVVEATPSIKENADNADAYFDAYEDAPDRDRYTLETENPEENAPAPSLYRWFWSWFE